jgi:CheY-like chemotaxis protein
MSRGRANILIVDDDVGLANSLATMLEAEGGYESRLVHCAADAVAAAVEFPPAIIFLDIELPDSSGYEVAILLRRHAQLQATRLIALTEHVEHLGREHARAAGFERYLVKPVTTIELHKVLRRRIRIGSESARITRTPTSLSL